MLLKIALWLVIFGAILTGCSHRPTNYTRNDIVKITDFELSPDEEKIAFSAITPVGNLDIWVVDIDAKNLKKLTFEDRSPTNHIARFFKKHRWRNFFEIDMISPKWTTDGKITFCQRLSKSDMWSTYTLSLRYLAINTDGTDKREKTDEDKIIRRKPFSPIRSFELSDYSEKHKKKIFLKDDSLWVLNSEESNPKRLIQ